jgi:hypothetical protein
MTGTGQTACEGRRQALDPALTGKVVHAVASLVLLANLGYLSRGEAPVGGGACADG